MRRSYAICFSRHRDHLKRYALESKTTSPVATCTEIKEESSRPHLIRTDLPRFMGGSDEAPQPVHLLLASLVGCEHATASFVARQMRPRVQLDSVTFRIYAERDQRGAIALPLEAVFAEDQKTGTVSSEQPSSLPSSSSSPPPPPPPTPSPLPPARLLRIYGEALVQTGASQDQIDELARHVKRRCPIANMIELSGCELDIVWQIEQAKVPNDDSNEDK